MPSREGNDGFTLVEILIAGALGALVIGGAATALLVAQRTSGRQGIQGQLEALIDQDLAAIQELDRRFTCCTGSPCTATAATIAASTSCRNAAGAAPSPGDENYYAPRQTDTTTVRAPDTTDFQNFRNACLTGGIATAFTALLPTAPVPAAPAGLTRGPETTDSAANRITLTYTGTNAGTTVTTRVVNLIPTAAAWCP